MSERKRAMGYIIDLTKKGEGGNETAPKRKILDQSNISHPTYHFHPAPAANEVVETPILYIDYTELKEYLPLLLHIVKQA